MARYELDQTASEIRMAATLREAQLRVDRRLQLDADVVHVVESVENLSATDRPSAWTQHVTLGPPFLENGVTEFRASATRSKVLESTFGTADYLSPATVFDWPHAPLAQGGTEDLVRLPRGLCLAPTPRTSWIRRYRMPTSSRIPRSAACSWIRI